MTGHLKANQNASVRGIVDAMSSTTRSYGVMAILSVAIAGGHAPREGHPPSSILHFAKAPVDVTGRELNTEGFRLYKQKKYREAAKRFEQALQADPTFALAHYNLACTLALLRQAGQACGQGATLATLFAHLEKAVELDGKRRKRMEEDRDLASIRKTFRYQVLKGLSPTKTKDVTTLLQHLAWVGPESGVYGPGSQLIFNANGTCVLKILDAFEDKVDWESHPGSYQVKDNRVEITLKKPFAGRKTHRGTLRPDGKLTVDSLPEHAPFTDGVPECEDEGG